MSNPLWHDNTIQFPRFISEADSAGAFTPEVVQKMADEMDLTEDEVASLIERATLAYDRIKAQL